MRQEIRGFTGGITDFVHTDNVNAFEELDNILITKDRNYISCLGSKLMGIEHSKPVTSVLECQRIAELNGKTYYIHGKQILEYDDGWTVLIGPLSDSLLTQGSLTSTQSYIVWNDHLVIVDNEGSRAIKIYHDENGLTKVVQAGLPKPSSGTITPDVASDRGYIYSFVFKYAYKSGDVNFLDLSSVHNVQILDASATQNDLTDLPVLTNDVDTLYDTSNVTLQIYRTGHEGSTGYLIAELPNGTTSYTDTTDDVELLTGVPLYNDGTLPQNDLPPVAKHIEISDNACFYANTNETPYRVWQSHVGDIDAVPESYYLDFEEEVMGLSSYQSNVIVFTVNQIWRIEGQLDALGGGELRKVLVKDKIGCLNHASIVKTDKGILFAGKDSFYITNGYEADKIPKEDVNFYNRYNKLSQFPENIQGTYDRVEQRVYWTTKNSLEYKIYIYDLTFGAFTTMSGLSGSFDTTSLFAKRNGEIIRGDKSGHVFIHDNTVYGNPVIDNMKLATNWQESPVIYKVKHIDFDFGAPDINKWVNKVTVTGDGRTSLDFDINSYDNSYDIPKTLKPVSFKSGSIWGDENEVWGDHNSIWELELRMSQTRRFRSGKIRTKSKQLEITNAITTLRTSFRDHPDSQMTVDGSTNMCTIIDNELATLPQHPIGKQLVINGKSYEIIDSGTDTVKVLDPSNTLVDGTYDWEIKGYAHNQQLHLSSFIYNYTPLDDDGGYFQEVSNA